MMSETIDISVVVPAYNAADTIQRAINSVMDQTYPARETIVVDDGSRDETVEVVRAYGSAVRIVCQKNAGVAAARNRGISESNCAWVAFLDADDWWMPHRLEAGVSILNGRPWLRWAAGAYTVLLPDGTSGEEPASSAYRALLTDSCYFPDFYKAAAANIPFHTCTMLIRKDLIVDAGFFDSSLRTSEDRDLWYRIADQHPAIGFVDRPIFVYDRRREGSLTRGVIASHSQDLWVLLQKHVPPVDSPNPLTSKAIFFRGEVNRAVRHAIRLGERENVARLAATYREWFTVSSVVLALALRLTPKSVWLRLAKLWRWLYDPVRERHRRHDAQPGR